MFRSLRFRLPALFLVGIVLAAVVAALIAVSSSRATPARMRRRAAGRVGGNRAALRAEGGHRARFRQEPRARARRDKVFWVPAVLEPPCSQARCPRSRAAPAFPRAPRRQAAWIDLHVRGTAYLGVAQEVEARRRPRSGSLVVAEPESALTQPLAAARVAARARVRDRDPRRRRRRPLLLAPHRAAARCLATAADEVAAGHYDVAVPERTWGSEVERLAARFHEMTARLSESESSPATSSCRCRTSCARR